MKRSISIILLFLCISLVSSAGAQTQELGGYTIIKGGTVPLICLGRWMPSKEPGRPGVCEGQMVDGSQLTAVSAKQTVDKLDQLLIFLEAMDQKLAENNSQMERLIDAIVSMQNAMTRTQEAIGQQTVQVGELMHDTISSRVDALSKRVLANENFKKELEKFKQDILMELKRYYPEQKAQ